ncbi:transporter substrate-binding domain-containing protein [Salinimicrobium soli]|uniref:transporter substrate-binding domain-containing protein n=1 Tax=Salinimicrobium soli TaxID=1254399 RepID=UPI003AAD4208
MRLIKGLIFFILLLSGVLSRPLQAQSDTLSPLSQKELRVGVNLQPPFIYKGEKGVLDGLSIRLWRTVAEDLNLNYKFVELPEDANISALENGKADVVLLGEVTAEAEEIVDFSHVYYTSRPGIASSGDLSLSAIAKGFFTKRFWYIVGILSILLLIVGTIIYFVERRKNEDNFGGERSIAHGIGAGFWWAGVTMTTIGYGDKAPITFFGRAIALLWMLVAMAVTAVLTASLVSVVGQSSDQTIHFPDDLRNKKVAVVKNSDAAEYLKMERISADEFPDAASAIEAVKSKKQDLVFHSLPSLRFELSNGSGNSLQARSVQAPEKLYAFGFPSNNQFREKINSSLLKILRSEVWQQELKRFVPEN